MRKLVGLFTTAIALTAALAVAGTQPRSGVVGSVHDMNTIEGLSDDAEGRVCAFCHTPHHALVDPTGEQQPLWSHNYTGYVNNWTPYQSPTLNANITDPLMGPSRLCMSCHDGVVAADQHYGGSQTGSNGNLVSDLWGGRAIGKAANGMADFSNDHPIGFSYTAARLADRGNSGLGGGLAEPTATFYGNTSIRIQDVLMNDEFMTCATCHDVHNKDNALNIKAPGKNYLVYAPQDSSALCLTCHLKGTPSLP